MNTSIGDLVTAAIAPDPTRPLLTWYDDRTGERTELSGATLANWIAKTANLLVDGAGLALGDPVAVLLPPHWQTAAVLLGAWTAGAAVDHGPDPHPVDVLFAVGPDTAPDWSAGERYAFALHPLALPMREVPPGWSDFVVEVRGHGDRFTPPEQVGGADPAVLGPVRLTHAEVLERARRRADELGVGAGARVLIDVEHHADPLDWLLAPLAAGATTVLCRHLDHTKLPSRIAAEQATVTLP